jgi:SAM-dependent methyltransferase/uncharacterized protein YbaR (Trm112 family)
MIFEGVEICCPSCRGDLRELPGAGLRCLSCAREFPVVLGIPDLRVLPDPYIDMEADRAKGILVASRFHELTFAELVAFYYSVTTVVPAHDARRYTRGLMAAVARAEQALRAWERVASNREPAPTRLLDVGCGTAPLLVAAGSRFPGLVGMDIAFRWLVVAKKRLAEAALDVPLICACAEALPFPAGSFDRVAMDSVLENVSDQRQALAECHRVLRPAGSLFISTPNRFSVGPDPQVGLWAGSMLPQRWLAAYVRSRGGIPPKRRLLSARSLVRLVREAGFWPPRLLLPEVAEAQRHHFGRTTRALIGVYHLSRRLAPTRALLRLVGPLLCAVSERPSVRRLHLQIQHAADRNAG